MMVSPSCVEVFALPTGYLWLPDRWIFADGDVDLKHLSPDYSFLIRHPSGRNVLFDLGMRKDLENNPTVIRDDYAAIDPYIPKDAFDLLCEGPVRPGDVDTVILSHMHFDHTGDVSRFPSAKIVLGSSTRECTQPGYPKAQFSPFDSTVLDHTGYYELTSSDAIKISPANVPDGCPFQIGFDVFGDSSLLIVDAPGHMPGHQIALARTGPKEWVSMGGDCCHHRALLEDPSRSISTDVGPNGQPGFHKDPADAKASIGKLQELHRMEDVFVVLAHDASLDGCIPLYPTALNGWREKNLKNALRTQDLELEEVKRRYH